jgi:hypothetical protein
MSRATMQMEIHEFRKDGWPLCPSCGDDELASRVMMAYMGIESAPTLAECLAGEFFCYACPWDSARIPKR